MNQISSTLISSRSLLAFSFLKSSDLFFFLNFRFVFSLAIAREAKASLDSSFGSTYSESLLSFCSYSYSTLASWTSSKGEFLPLSELASELLFLSESSTFSVYSSDLESEDLSFCTSLVNLF